MALNVVGDSMSPATEIEVSGESPTYRLIEPLTQGDWLQSPWIASTAESARFLGASPIPGTEAWWKLGGFIKGDLSDQFKMGGRC